jgi:hypothetical protein
MELREASRFVIAIGFVFIAVQYVYNNTNRVRMLVKRKKWNEIVSRARDLQINGGAN